MFSESQTIQDVINRFMELSKESIDATKIGVKNQATGYSKNLEPTIQCKGLLHVSFDISQQDFVYSNIYIITNFRY